jgi:hypothetical protein
LVQKVQTEWNFSEKTLKGGVRLHMDDAYVVEEEGEGSRVNLLFYGDID